MTSSKSDILIIGITGKSLKLASLNTQERLIIPPQIFCITNKEIKFNASMITQSHTNTNSHITISLPTLLRGDTNQNIMMLSA